MNNPWECPRCNRINAPWMPQCNCKVEKESHMDAIKRLAQKNTEETAKRIKFIESAYKQICYAGDHDFSEFGFCKRCNCYPKDVPCVGGWL